MNGKKLSAVVVLLFVLIGAGLGQAASPKSPALAGVVLKDGTPVVLRLTEQVSSETHQTGSMVNLAVSIDVVVDGKTVIAAGTTARGTVTWSEGKGRIGRAGKLQIAVDNTTGVDGQRVALRSTVARTGKDSETSSVALGIICCPLFLLMKGEDVVYPIGTELKAYVEGEYTFK